MALFPLLLLCLTTGSVTANSCTKPDGLVCVYDYWQNVSCVLNNTDGEAKNTDRWFNFTRIPPGDGARFECRFERNPSRCQFDTGMLLRSYHEFRVQSCNSSGCYEISQFMPVDCVQTTSPSDVSVNSSLDSFIITWKSGYKNHIYIKPETLTYKVLLPKAHGRHESKQIQDGELSITLDYSRLDLSSEYCVRVKSKYKNAVRWSEWSESVCWQRGEDQSQMGVYLLTAGVLLPVCVFAGLLLWRSVLSTRLKVRSLLQVPSPAPYFQPLFLHYEGNLHEWLSSPGAYMVTFDPDSRVNARHITMAPRAAQYGLEEENSKLSPQPASPPQDPLSYIMAPGAAAFVPRAPPHPTTIAAVVDMSYVAFPGATALLCCAEEASEAASMDTSQAESGSG
ncbi:interleukin-21 receptor-like [Gadus chalcogrammus]|uniref:interleukin-21 receptor-like n=1 Tax=Gadus chalcogrammus TaxID=1042646 RepID=UPI0024C36979|nr:interleukin-21 receptor-like [Gadus chalcogrammus]